MADPARKQALDVLESNLDNPKYAQYRDQISAVLEQNGRPQTTEGKLGKMRGQGGPITEAAPPEIKAAQKAKVEAPTPKMTVDLGLGPREYADDDSFGSRVVRGMKRIKGGAEHAAMLANEAVNAGTLQLPRAIARDISSLTGTQIGPSDADYAKFDEANPTQSALANFGGSVNPYSAGAKLFGVGMKALDPVAKMALAKGLGAGQTKLLQTAVAGGGAAAGNAAATNIVEGGNTWQALEAAGEAAPAGAVFAGVGQALASGAGAAANAWRARSEPIQQLARAGLEPGPVPGRPVIRMNEPIMSQLPIATEPPLGVSRVTPRTRARAGRKAGDVVREDLASRSQANNQTFGRMKNEALAVEGDMPADYRPILADINARLTNKSIGDPTRKALEDVRNKFAEYIPKPPAPPPPPPPEPLELAAMRQQLAGLPPKNQATRVALQRMIAEMEASLPKPEPPPAPPAPKPFTARDLDQIRDYADGKVSGGEVKRGDIDFVQLSANMRQQLPERLAAVNEQQHDILTGFEQRQALINQPTAGLGRTPIAQEARAQRAGQKIRQSGEETATAGAGETDEGTRSQRLAQLGNPPVLPGTPLPDHPPNYQPFLEVPQLQLAQEHFQIPPGKVFSGGGGAIGGMLNILGRTATLAPPRLLYPTLRRIGESEPGQMAAGGDELVQTVRNRKRKQKKEAEPKERK